MVAVRHFRHIAERSSAMTLTLRQSMTSFSVTIVRHGETSYNKEGIIQGQTNIPLSDAGHLQAQLVAERLRYCLFTHAFTSDLARANQTAETILKENKVCKCGLQKDKRLRERRFGEFEGKTVQELMAKAKQVVGPTRSWTEYNPQGAETYNEVQDRASAFFHELCRDVLLSDDEVKGLDSARSSCCDGTLRNTGGHRSGGMKNSSKEENGLDVKDNYAKRRKQDSEMTPCEFSYDLPKSRDLYSTSETTVKEKKYQTSLSDDFANRKLNQNTDSKSEVAVLGHILPNLNDTESKNEVLEVLTKSSNRKDEEEEDEWVTFEKEHSNTSLGDESYAHKLTSTVHSNNSNKSVCHSSSSVPDLSDQTEKSKMISVQTSSSVLDGDCDSHLAANVLLVSHGGLIKELLKYFTQDLGCELPGGNHLALKICQNCSISKFIVSVSQYVKKPSIKCLYLNERDHLKGMGDAIGKF